MIRHGSRRTPIRRASGVPAYIQVSDILAAQMEHAPVGDEGRALPSEDGLAKEFSVSRVTIRQALMRLESRGLIYSAQGRGYFRTEFRMKGISGFHSFTKEVEKAGSRASSVVIGNQVVPKLPSEMERHLELLPSEGSSFLFLKRLRLIDAKPVAVEDAYLPLDLYPGIDAAEIGRGSLYEAIDETWGIVPMWTDALFEPLAATADLAALLDVEPGSPLMAIWRITLTEKDQVMEYVKSIYRGGDFRLHVSRYRLTS